MKNFYIIVQIEQALVAEVVDALDLKSNQAHPWCRFKSGSRQVLHSLLGVFFINIKFEYKKPAKLQVFSLD